MLALRENAAQANGKNVLVKFPGTERKAQQLTVVPDMTASALLSVLRLSPSDYVVGKGSAHTTYGNKEHIYPSLSKGENLYVNARVDAGS